MSNKTEIEATRAIGRIKDKLEEVSVFAISDLLKTAVEIYELSREDAGIADNMKDYWMHQACGAER